MACTRQNYMDRMLGRLKSAAIAVENSNAFELAGKTETLVKTLHRFLFQLDCGAPLPSDWEIKRGTASAHVLKVLDNGRCEKTSGEIAESSLLKTGTFSQLLKKMAEQGIVKKAGTHKGVTTWRSV